LLLLEAVAAEQLQFFVHVQDNMLEGEAVAAADWDIKTITLLPAVVLIPLLSVVVGEAVVMEAILILYLPVWLKAAAALLGEQIHLLTAPALLQVLEVVMAVAGDIAVDPSQLTQVAAVAALADTPVAGIMVVLVKAVLSVKALHVTPKRDKPGAAAAVHQLPQDQLRVAAAAVQGFWAKALMGP
jgi:hypothetical protein